MKTVSVSDFKSHCLGLLEEAKLTGESIQILKRGKPLATVIPDFGKATYKGGAFKDTVRIVGEIMVDGVDLGVEWEAGN